jgi:hypothetical protein
MGRRSEQRVRISFPVIVRGLDARGSPFSITAETRDISCTGACLIGADRIAELGKKIEIESQDQRAWYRVQWIQKTVNGKPGRVGVRCLEPGKYIWGIAPKEWEADSFDPSLAAPPSASGSSSGYGAGPPAGWSGQDRRKFARHACRIEAQVSIAGDSVHLPARVTDISLGGCYVEMLAPLPVDTIVELSLNPGGSLMVASGRVRSSQMGFGMGVSFTGLGPEDFEILRKLAPPEPNAPKLPAASSARPSPPPPLAPSPAPARGNGASAISSSASPSHPLYPLTTEEALDAVVRLLLRKGVFTPAEISEELEKLKIVKK